MISEDAISLLRKTPPFSFLDDETIRNMVRRSLMEFYPKGHVILRQNGPAPDHLSIIRNGDVKIFVKTNEGEEILVDHRTGGDFFGLRSIVCGHISRETVVAKRDTSCYLIEKETILKLLKADAVFSEFCLKTLLKRLADITYRDICDRKLLYGGGDKLLFTNTLGDFAARKVITESEDISIKKAAETMAAHGISSLVLLDSDGFPSGVITDRDLRNKVVSKGRDPDGRVGDVMSVTLIKAEAGDYCFEALLKMLRYNIHHLLVVSEGELRGIITAHDLMTLQGTAPLSVAGEIENQDTIDGLVPVSRKINKVISLLIKEGAQAGNIIRIITEINDRLMKKLLEITESRLGPAPVGYCWIVYGSEGRKEQTFRTDQDNAIIYDDSAKNMGGVEEYFTQFAFQMRDALEKCGFPPCTADYMASNPKWRQPLSVWKKYFIDWINKPTPEAVLLSLIFFDFRPVYGDVLLAEKLRAFLGRELKDKNFFLAHMAGIVSRNKPPVNFLGKLCGEKEGGHKGKFNIKNKALCPIIDAARLSALETGIYNTSTIERLRELKDRRGTASRFSDDLEHAFEFLMSLRLRHQYRQIEEGIEPDNFIDPRGLRSMERKMLKEVMGLIASVQNSAMKKYSEWGVA
jgi:CBS domain-containing protein